MIRPVAISKSQIQLWGKGAELALKEYFIKPYQVAIVYFQKIATTLKKHLINISWDSFSFSIITYDLLLGLALLIPLVNSIVYAILKRYFPSQVPKEVLLSNSTRRQLTSSSPNSPTLLLRVPPPPKTFLDLPAPMLDLIFSYLDVYALGIQSMVCHELNATVMQSTMWLKWALRFGITVQKGEKAREKVLALLTHFALDRSTQKLICVKKAFQALEKPEILRDAFNAYPWPAWLMLVHREEYFHFCYRDLNNNVHILCHVPKRSAMSQSRQAAEEVIKDRRYVQLKPFKPLVAKRAEIA